MKILGELDKPKGRTLKQKRWLPIWKTVYFLLSGWRAMEKKASLRSIEAKKSPS